MDIRNEEPEINMVRLLGALWKKAWVILLAAGILAGAAFGATALFVTPLYRAEALMYVNSSNISVGGTKVSISQGELSAAQSLVKTYIVILNTRSTLNEVIQRSGVNRTYEELKGMIRAESVNATEIFSINVTSPSPGEAEHLANTIAQVLPEKIASVVEGSSARIVDPAVVPAKKASPSLGRNAAIGGLLGFAAACCTIAVIYLMDNKIHDSDYLIQTYDIPILAVIPDLLSTKISNDYYQAPEHGG